MVHCSVALLTKMSAANNAVTPIAAAVNAFGLIVRFSPLPSLPLPSQNIRPKPLVKPARQLLPAAFPPMRS